MTNSTVALVASATGHSEGGAHASKMTSSRQSNRSSNRYIAESISSSEMYRGPSRLRLHRPIDITVALVGLIVTSPVLVAGWAAAKLSSGGSGFFRQIRIGQQGIPFEIIKLRSMNASSTGSAVTTADDDRITAVGRTLRRYKIDELPQLINVLRGEMALVGPRPDVPGFADELSGDARRLLHIRPGITGPASLLFGREEELLASVDDPDAFNSEVLFPAKTLINLAWLNEGTLLTDLRLIVLTLRSPEPSEVRERLQALSPGLDLDDACPALAMGGWEW